jgi:hypothetical protein
MVISALEIDCSIDGYGIRAGILHSLFIRFWLATETFS